jgi:hypothetical protein
MGKLFEHVSGNKFKLITESTDPASNLIREGIKKVFAAAEGNELSYQRVQGVGLGYIKDINEARKCALKEARDVAPDFGFMDVEESSKFVKLSESSRTL